MGRLEASAWPLACGSFCVFALAVVLREADWRVGFAAVLATAAAWALAAPAPAATALGGVAWTLVTAFDVDKTGELAVPHAGDLARAAVLLAACLAAAGARRARRRRPAG